MKKFFELYTSSLPQSTIERVGEIEGYTLRWFSGKSIVRFLPSEKEGLFFRLDRKEIAVSPQNIIFDEKHCTSLKSGLVEVRETEHVLSAVHGLGITNLVIEIEGSGEPPIMDGSSKPFVEVLLKSGIKRLSEKRREIRIVREFSFSLPGSESFIRAEPFDGLFIDMTVDYPLPIGKQHLSISVNPESYQKEIAFARPPLRCSIEEASEEKLKEWFRGWQEAKDSIVYYSKKEYLTPLRSEDEMVRHKILDFIGDIANIGFPIKGKFVCFKVGHRINGEFTRLFAS